MSALCLDRLHAGGLITNYGCSSACAHCVYRSSPRRDHAYITPAQADANIRAVRRLGCRTLHIGGGEPFLDVAALLEVLRVAQANRVGIEYIETNASWFRAEDQTVDLLRQLQGLGCQTLLVSIDPFHNAFIPFRKVKGLMAACQRAGTSVFPWRMEFFDEMDHFDDQCTHDLDEYERAYGPDYLASLERRYGVNLGGRALATFSACHPQQPLARILEEGRRPCSILSNGSHFHTDLYGDFIPTKCPGLAVAIADLGMPLAPSRYPSLVRLYSGGPSALYEQAVGFGFVARATYTLPCELCDHVRTFLAARAPTSFPDLRPAGFYTVDRPAAPEAGAATLPASPGAAVDRARAEGILCT
jgi:hypothetical protein